MSVGRETKECGISLFSQDRINSIKAGKRGLNMYSIFGSNLALLKIKHEIRGHIRVGVIADDFSNIIVNGCYTSYVIIYSYLK